VSEGSSPKEGEWRAENLRFRSEKISGTSPRIGALFKEEGGEGGKGSGGLSGRGIYIPYLGGGT